MKHFFTFLLALSFWNINAARVTPSQFVEIAGKQRVLSQRIAKDFMLLTYYKEHKSTELDLKIAMSIFKRNLGVLKTFAVGNEKLIAALELQRTAWNSFSKAVAKEKKPGNSVEVLKLSETVLKTSDYVMVIGRKSNRKESLNIELAGLINVTSKQSMLSQRLCLLFLNQKIQGQLEKKNKMGSASFEQAFTEMDDSIGYIISSPYNLKADTELMAGKASLEFDSFKENEVDFIEGKLEIEQVVTITNSLTKLYDNLTYEYAKL